MDSYKVVVVDDSAFMRKIISDLIETDSIFQVIGTAVNGREAIQKISELKPDIVTMDVEMPEMNGLEALKAVMESYPIPVIMLSGINESGLEETILALESGAFDFIRKPSASNSQDIIQVKELLLEKMHSAMQAKQRREARRLEEVGKQNEVIQEINPILKSKPMTLATAGSVKAPEIKVARAAPTRNMLQKEIRNPKINTLYEPVKRNVQSVKPEHVIQKVVLPGIAKIVPKVVPKAVPKIVPKVRQDESKNSSFQHLIAIGCSTGGPRALKTLLEKIPEDIPAAIVIVQHMPPKFTKSLAQRLNSFSAIEVVEAEHGMILQQGYAYIAPGGFHMTIRSSSIGQYAISISAEVARNGHRPSVDTMFESLLQLHNIERHVVLLTGMGSDGAKSMKQLYDSGVNDTYAESEETCIVYGMPRSAVELKCVTHILPLEEIPNKIVRMLK
ncbi:two-component system chemotaxis response regulator CheB [Paenibacillus sp. DS2015]|uniref:protein-glutamate methylesterase/protein-glutamine glutaminase n=1 Tax=Paenibacillus sp. DS2015 TaxID=3373917 RepID=UPI003D22459C